MRFYLGTHHPGWLGRAGVPLFVSYGSLRSRKSLPTASARWALDSRGFSELSAHGTWTIPAAEYAANVRRYRDEIGMLDWAAIQDWMCEPLIRTKTGLSVEEHQDRTIQSWLRLRELAPDVPWTPVLQGWGFGDYLRHVEAYDRADSSWRDGVVGLGSVCRRQTTPWVSALVQILKAEGVRVHAFGFKRTGLPSVAPYLESTDSLAWSDHARNNPHDYATPACRRTHKSCSNCLPYALLWRDEMLAPLERMAA